MQGRRAKAPCRLLLLLLLLSLLTAGPPASAGQAADTLHARQAALAGLGTGVSPLAGLVLEEAACLGSPSMTVAVARGVLHVDNETTEAWVNPSVGTPRGHTRQTAPLSNATADGFRLDPDCRILVLPLQKRPWPEASFALEGASVLPPIAEELAFQPRGSLDRETMGIPAGTLPLQGAQAGSLVLRAPFRLVVWEGSFELHDRNGTSSVETGTEMEPIAGTTLAQRHVQREAYLDVEDGSLSIALGPSIRLYAASLDLAVETGRLHLHDPEGTLPLRKAPVPSGSRLLELEGPTALRMTAADGRLTADVHDDPPVVYLDGVAIRPEPAPGLLGPLALGTLALAVVALAVHRVADRRAARRMGELDSLLERQRYGEALALSRRIRGRGTRREGARLAEATCLIQMARFREAREALARGGWSAATGPIRDYLMATAEAGSGQTAAATRHLARCLLKAPSFAAEALANPLLGPVVRDALAANRAPVAGESYA